MIDIAALMGGLPVSGLEPETVALIKGITYPPSDRPWMDSLTLLEPPANQQSPYIDPFIALQMLLSRQGNLQLALSEEAHGLVARMRAEVAEERWVNFFEDEPDSSDCLPVSDFLMWLRQEGHQLKELSITPGMDVHDPEAAGSHSALVPADILDFLEDAARTTATAPIFLGWGGQGELSSIEAVHALPAPSHLIEFVPSPPWLGLTVVDRSDANLEPFLRWREDMRAVALELEKALGKQVYYFADLN